MSPVTARADKKTEMLHKMPRDTGGMIRGMKARLLRRVNYN